MQIKGVEGLTGQQLAAEVEKGGKFVVYTYCFSIVIMTFKRTSDIFFVRAGQSAVSPGIIYSLLTLLVGWWGIPWGPIWTIGALTNNFKGGKDITQETLAALQQSATG